MDDTSMHGLTAEQTRKSRLAEDNSGRRKYMREWRAQNPGKVRAHNRDFLAKNPGYARKHRAEMMAADPEAVLLAERERTRRRAARIAAKLAAELDAVRPPKPVLSEDEKIEKLRGYAREHRGLPPVGRRAAKMAESAARIAENPEAERERGQKPQPVLSDEEKAAKRRDYNREYGRKRRGSTPRPPRPALSERQRESEPMSNAERCRRYQAKLRGEPLPPRPTLSEEERAERNRAACRRYQAKRASFSQPKKRKSEPMPIANRTGKGRRNDGRAMALYWLSFADPDRPEGSQF